MELLTRREFNGVALDCYKADNEDDGFWATREQIGQLLGSSKETIASIHKRHKKVFAKCSKTMRINSQETIVYNFRGLVEFCRRSKCSSANAVWDSFTDKVTEGFLKIRRTGSYNSQLEAGKMLLRVLEKSEYQLSGRERRRILSDATYLISGERFDERFYSCKDIAKELNITEKRVFNKALNKGIIRTEDNVYGFWDKNQEWFFNELGHEKMLELFASLKYWWLK